MKAQQSFFQDNKKTLSPRGQADGSSPNGWIPKGHVQGVVHDVSRTGETAFIEPMSIIGLSNEFENILADEKARGYEDIARTRLTD